MLPRHKLLVAFIDRRRRCQWHSTEEPLPPSFLLCPSLRPSFLPHSAFPRRHHRRWRALHRTMALATSSSWLLSVPVCLSVCVSQCVCCSLFSVSVLGLFSFLCLFVCDPLYVLLFVRSSLSICLSCLVCLCLSVSPSVCCSLSLSYFVCIPSSVCLSVCLYTHIFIFLSLLLSLALLASLCLCLSVYGLFCVCMAFVFSSDGSRPPSA